MEEKHGCLLVSFDFEAGDVPTVLVGCKSKTKKDDVCVCAYITLKKSW